MRLPNLLGSRWGRLIAFFFLYVTEGIPLGFTATTMVVQMKRAGVGEAEIGIFISSLYLPWAWKWVMGPIVDLLYSNRLGARRGWILGTQLMMVLTLMVCMPIELASENLELITLVIMVHNAFCATQDVAIDALACNVLHERERGLANGLMFAGQTLGIPLGGACVLYLIEGIDLAWLPALRDGIPVQSAYWFVIGCILAVTLLVALPMREPLKQRTREEGGWFVVAMVELGQYLRVALRSFLGSRVAFFALLFALLPAGAVGLNLALQKTVAVEVGFSDGDVADLEVVASILWAVMCVLGGVISDRLGHLKCLAVFLMLISLPTFWCAYRMQQEGVIFPRGVVAQASPGAAVELSETSSGGQQVESPEGKRVAAGDKMPSIFAAAEAPPIAYAFWWSVMVYMGLQGLMYGTRTAVFMRIANPDVAATQFTAYMAMMNLVTVYTAWWQGYAIERWGYPSTLYLDGALGLVCIAILPLMRERAGPVVDAS
ncbi:MAG: MFS transporter [Planctomycetota bacterium]|nr:MFS transporter [Planctomycetota bacterium]